MHEQPFFRYETFWSTLNGQLKYEASARLQQRSCEVARRAPIHTITSVSSPGQAVNPPTSVQRRLPPHTPPVQVSTSVQALPSLQAVPSGLLAKLQVPSPLQVAEAWHGLGVQT